LATGVTLVSNFLGRARSELDHLHTLLTTQ